MTYPYTPPYTPTGPFNTGGAPGINAPFLTELEGWVANFDAPTPVILNGATSGTATLYQNMTGTVKLVIVVCSSFRNGGGSNQNLAIPVPFTQGFQVQSGDIPAISFVQSSSVKNFTVITGLASGGGSNSTVSVLGSWSFGESLSAIDTIQFNSGGASNHSGLIIMKGI